MFKCYSIRLKSFLKLCLVIATTVCSIPTINAQTKPIKQWEKRFGGYGMDDLKDVKQAFDGGFYLGGSSTSGKGADKSEERKGEFHYWIVKTDAEGNKLWDRSFGNAGYHNYTFSSLSPTADGGCILGGMTAAPAGGDQTEPNKGSSSTVDYWVIKVDKFGNKQWDKTIGGNTTDQFESLQQTSDGGYIVAGWSFSGAGMDKSEPSNGSGDFWIVKLDSTGNKIWDRSIGGASSEPLRTIQQTSDGGYIVGGITYSTIQNDKFKEENGLYDTWIVRLDANGNILWDKVFGRKMQDELCALQQTSDGGFIFAGYSEKVKKNVKVWIRKRCGLPQKEEVDSWIIKDHWVIKLDANGKNQWKRFFNQKNQKLSSLVQTADGGFVFTGFHEYSDYDRRPDKKYETWLTKLNANGRRKWTITSKNGRFNSVQPTSDGGMIIGSSAGTKETESDYFIIKFSR